MTEPERRSIEKWLLWPMQARELAGVIDEAFQGTWSPRPYYQDWLPWIFMKMGSTEGILDLRECQQVLRGGGWSLNLAAGLSRKEEGLDLNETRAHGWLTQMRHLAHDFARQDANGEVTVDPLRVWADTYGLLPDKPSRWGNVFCWDGAFVFTGEWRPSKYPGNHGRFVRVWRSLKCTSAVPTRSHLKLVNP